jgi:hypothetical protein
VIEGKENIKYILMNINVLYRYLLCSGSLGEIYSEIFLKNEGINVIRDLQSYLESLKDQFSESDWEEQTYLLSLIVIHLYREIKIDKNVVDRRKQNYANTIETQYFEEFKDLSLNMNKDVAEHKKNPYDGLEELLPSQIMQKPIVTKIFSRLEALLQKENQTEDTDDRKVYTRKFMDLLLICFDKKINRQRFVSEDSDAFLLQRKTLFDRLLIDFITPER